VAVQPLIEQHIIFISATNSFNPSAIYSNSLVQSLAANSIGNDLIEDVQNYAHWDTVNLVWSFNSFLEFKCYITAAFQATVQANIPALQAAFPQYTIVTWGNATSFGN